MKTKLFTRLTPLYIAAFFQSLNFWFAIEKIFMRSIGFDDVAIGIAAALFTAVVVLLEAPSGILADRWSRKGVLIIASVAMVATSLLAGLSDTVLMYTLSIMLIGVYFAMYSGTYEAVVYDTLLEEQGESDRYEATYGRFQIIFSISLILGSIFGGVISSIYEPQTAYFATIPAALLAIVALLFFKEPKLHKNVDERTVITQVRDTFRMVAGKEAARALVIVLTMLIASTALLFEYAQVWYLALMVPVVWFGVLYASLNAAIGFAGFLAQFVAKKDYLIMGAFGLIITASIGLLFEQLWLLIAAQFVLQTFLIVLTVVLTKRFQDTVTSRNRAGAGSALGTMAQLLAIALYLVFGFVSDTYSVYTAGIIFVIMASFATMISWHGKVLRVYTRIHE